MAHGAQWENPALSGLLEKMEFENFVSKDNIFKTGLDIKK